MWKLISAFISMLRECLFDSKEEGDIRSSKFNTKKFFIMIAIVLSLATNLLAVNRLAQVHKALQTAKNQHDVCIKNNE